MSAGPAIIYNFESFALDPGRFELRADGKAVHLEPQVLSLLILLASNPDRLVSKDEIVEKIWSGRFISDSAIAARVKSARQALGDDGKQQRLIKTVHGKGFRFVGQVEFEHESTPSTTAPPDMPAVLIEDTAPPPPADTRPSIAVLPFELRGEAGPLAFLADALPDELIADLARLRWLMVIARGSSFRFRSRDTDSRDIGRALGVRYCLSGSMEVFGGKVTLQVALADTRDNAVVWSERYAAGVDEIHDLRREILGSVIGNLETTISQHEAQQARQLPDTALDSWSAYHLGLDHMFRFNKADNARAASLFERAIELNPQFGRAFGGLSFTRFQDAFLAYSPDRGSKAEDALRLANEALLLDRRDPFAHLNLGRARWLDGKMDESIQSLSDSIALAPSYAQAVYSKSWAQMTKCDADGCENNASLALRLSPLDPLRYAMIGVRSIGALLRGDYENAALLGEQAARSPGAHKHIALIAALGTQAAGKTADAAEWVARARIFDPQVDGASFMRAFPFSEGTERELIEATLRKLGL